MAESKKSRYGLPLAEQVAAALQAGQVLAAYHRDYCGMGLECLQGTFFYGEVWDGQLQSWNTHENRAASVLMFPDCAAFVAWLSEQSDTTLSRHEVAESFYWDNQTINRQRLRAFVAGHPANARPAWYQALLTGFASANQPSGSEDQL